ncbi:VCBS domain-containing protein, partial [Mesorhizobium argentiipisi]
PNAYDALKQGENAVLNLSYNVVDEHGASVAQTAQVTITGANDAPTVSAAVTSTASEDAAAYTIDLLTNAADVDHDAVLHIA